MANSHRRATKAAGVSKPGDGGKGSGDDRAGAAPKGNEPNEAIIRGAEQRLEIEKYKGREAEFKQQIAMLSERCAEVSGEIAKGNLIIAAKDAQIEQLQLEMVEMAKGGAG